MPSPSFAGTKGDTGPIGPPGVNTLLSGYTIWVDQASPDATDARGGLSPYDQAHPYLTIGAAIADAVPYQDWIIVRAGTYAERLVLVPGISLVGTYNTFVEPPDADPLPLILLDDDCFLSYFSLTVPTAATCVVFAGAGTAYTDHLDFYGQGGTGRCLGMAGTGLLDIVTNWLSDGSVDVILDLLSGDAQCVEFGLYKTGTTANIIADVAAGASLDLADFFCIDGIVPTTAIRCAGTIRGHSTRISNAVVGMQITAATADVVLVVIMSNNTTDLLVDPAAGAAQVKLSGQWSLEKVSAPASWWTNPMTAALGFDVSSADPGTKLLGKFGIGSLAGGSEVGIGTGLPTTVGMRVLTNTNLEVGVWGEITANLIDGPAVALFAGSGIGQALYVGGNDPFWALKFDVVVAALPATGTIIAEYWNGATWVQLRVMTVDEVHPHSQRGNRLFETAGEQYIRFDQPTANLLTLNGIQKYWMRFRQTFALATVPTADLARLQGSGTHFEAEGSLIYFGLAEEPELIPGTNLASRIALVTFVPGNASANVANGMNFNIQANSLVNGVTDGFGGVFSVPDGLDTTRDLTFGLEFTGSDAGVGNVDFQYWWLVTGPGSVYNGTAVAPIVAFSVAKSVAANVAIQSSVTFNLGQSLVLPGQTFWWSLRRLGGTDTYNGNVSITNVNLYGYHWH